MLVYDCGVEKWIKGANLRANRAMSCGCGRNDNENWGQKIVPKDSKYFFRNWLNIWQRKSTKKRPLEFTLTLEQLDGQYDKQNGRCYYSGTKLIPSTTSRNCFEETNISIDRIDNAKGYTIDNIVLCTKVINVARNIQTQEEFIQMCLDITNYQSELRRQCSSTVS